MVEKTLLRCEVCGAPYVEVSEEVRRWLPEAVRDKVKFMPACDCSSHQKRKAALEELERKQEEARRRELEEAFKRSRLSKRFRKRTLESFIPTDEKQREALSVFRDIAEHFSEYIEKDINGIYLFGLPGRGKTHLAAGLVNELIQKDVFCIYEKSSGLLSRFFDAVREKTSQGSIIQPMLQAELLVLDDLGAEEKHEFMSAKLYEIFDHRMEWLLPTVITSNLSLPEIKVRYGVRVASRIERMCRILEI